MKIIKENMLYSIEELNKVIKQSKSFSEIERALYDISRYHRMAAISLLFCKADINEFCHHLSMSGEMRKKYLLLSKDNKENSKDRFQCASIISPFFDSTAANNIALAKDIAGLSSVQWFEEEEYEDDFLYARFLYEFICGDFTPDKDQIEEILEKFELSLEGQPSTRYDISKALYLKDEKLFEEHFNNLIEERIEYFGEKEHSMISDIDFHKTEKHIFIEGLALLKTAEKVGFKTQEEYQYCPSLARH